MITTRSHPKDRTSKEMLSEHEGGSDKSEDSSSSDSESPPSPPRVDDSPLQKCMDRNKQCKNYHNNIYLFFPTLSAVVYSRHP